MMASGYPNKAALEEALEIYLGSMREFIERCLGGGSGESAADAIEGALINWRKEPFRESLRNGTSVRGSIEFGDIRYLIDRRWSQTFSRQFASDLQTIRNELLLANEARNQTQRAESDLDAEYVRARLSDLAGMLERVGAADAAASLGRIRAGLSDGGPAAPAPGSAQIEETGTDSPAARSQTPPVQAETELLGRAGAPPVEVQIRQGSALPDYSYPNYDALSTGSKIYTDAMRRLIRDRLSGSSPDDWWDTLVLRKLESRQRSSIEQKTRELHEKDLIDLVDAPHFVNLVMRNYELFHDVFGTGNRNERVTRRRLADAVDARNEGPGHSPTGDLNGDFVQLSLLAMKHLLEKFDRPAADSIDALFGSLTREAAPEAAQPMRERGVHVPVRGPGLLRGALKRTGGSLVSIRLGVDALGRSTSPGSRRRSVVHRLTRGERGSRQSRGASRSCALQPDRRREREPDRRPDAHRHPDGDPDRRPNGHRHPADGEDPESPLPTTPPPLATPAPTASPTLPTPSADRHPDPRRRDGIATAVTPTPTPPITVDASPRHRRPWRRARPPTAKPTATPTPTCEEGVWRRAGCYLSPRGPPATADAGRRGSGLHYIHTLPMETLVPV